MTNTAIDAFDRLIADVIPMARHHDSVKSDVDAVRTALSNAPQVVTFNDFEMRYYQDRLGRVPTQAAEYIMERYPNGLKITAAPNGGA